MTPKMASAPEPLDESAQVLATEIIATKTTKFWITNPDKIGQHVTYEYDAMPGSQPHKQGHHLFVYNSDEPEIPFFKKPLASDEVPTDDPHGTGVFEDAEIGSGAHVFCYAVGPVPKMIVSMAFIPATDDNKPVSSVYPGLSGLEVATGHVLTEYVMAPGVQPQNDGDQIAIFKGGTFGDLYKLTPEWTAPVKSNDSTGSAHINGTRIVRNQVYTLAYLKLDEKLDLNINPRIACALSFKVV